MTIVGRGVVRFQVCMDRRSISGLTVSHVTIQDSISSGVTIVAPGSAKGDGTLSGAKFESVNISIRESVDHNTMICGSERMHLGALRCGIRQLRILRMNPSILTSTGGKWV